MNAYQHMQRIARTLREDELVQSYGEAGLDVWPASRRQQWDGESAPTMVWEEGPFEWAYEFAGTDGRKLGHELYGYTTTKATRDAVAALRADGFYLECVNSFMLSAHRV